MLETILTMGGFGWYVWPAYGVTFFIFLLQAVLAWRERKSILNLVKQVNQK